ncbi:invasion associated locus B family protein [Devosia rhodophyticola]|uniref:Invasion associated locus B family protein n=1 Tax=Devosia rhodophyticola TaxID=3026423 RepID=A0ABY7YWP7_9HYPH|nr:invasion associated locus B family protein [Devosia rhodophyticola]WDR05741.1 invasion associated locus B family protein [Devosia rhodophyticola]
MNLRKPLVAGISVAAMLLSAMSAYAQDNSAPVPATATPVPAQSDAPTPPAVASPWLKVCGDPMEDGKKACIMSQQVVVNGQPLASFTLRDDPGQESRLLAVAQLPLGVLLPFSLTWQIDSAKPVRVPFMLCDPGGCSSQLVINEAYINSLKHGNTLKLIAKNRFNKDLVISVNLSGFTAKYDGEQDYSWDEFQKIASGQSALDQNSGGAALEKGVADQAEELRKKLTESVKPDGAAPAN